MPHRSIHTVLIMILVILSSLFTFHSSLFGQDNCSVELNKKDAQIYDDGVAYFKRGNYTLALQAMKQVLNGNPDFVDATYVAGMSWYKMADPNLKEAEKSFLRTITLCPAYDVYAYYYLGEISYSFEQFDKTVQYLTEFLKDVERRSKKTRIITGQFSFWTIESRYGNR